MCDTCKGRQFIKVYDGWDKLFSLKKIDAERWRAFRHNPLIDRVIICPDCTKIGKETTPIFLPAELDKIRKYGVVGVLEHYKSAPLPEKKEEKPSIEAEKQEKEQENAPKSSQKMKKVQSKVNIPVEEEKSRIGQFQANGDWLGGKIPDDYKGSGFDFLEDNVL